ncbi:Zinc finger protein Xfin [Cladobotryum mycophilum]|uniref:Zinc finger protein Xfin n=1 Tax=Cladobotryum mycophilum TaxID=491253 RepID=A0ABR0SSQ3_9HYPO
MEVTSFTSRRPAAGTLPTFSLPPPTSEVPSMASQPSHSSQPRSLPYSIMRYLDNSDLTPSSPGAGDGLSPSISSVHTGSSQGSQAATNMQYTYSGHVHGGWPTPGGSSYNISSGAGAQQSLGQNGYGARSSMYNQPSMSYGQRSSQSPATGGEGLPAPPYEQVHPSFQNSMSGGTANGGHENHATMQSGTMLATHGSTQPPTPSSAPAHVDSYTHSRPSVTTPNYTSSAPHHQQSFSSYTTQSPPPNHSPTSMGPLPRSLGSLSSQGAPPSMAPPYRYQYQLPPAMTGGVMTNLHQPNGQMSMMPGMVPPPYGHHSMMYQHAQPPPQSERPFKCDQCVQSFSRNHDLKRHKRIHLAVKPFPCSYCSKSFSRKDALKRHRLVKGCENKVNTENNAANAESVNHTRNGETEDDGTGLRKTP